MHIDVVQSTAGTSLQPTKQIKTGDVVHGKVMASADGKAAIKLQDGSSFNATLAEGVSLKEGQQVKLVVTGQLDGKMTMQIAPEGEGAAQLAESTLSGMNLPTGGRNVELATAFLRQGVSLSPELLQRAADIMAENPGLDPDTAAFMATNNMDSSLGQAVQDLASRQNGIASQLAALEQILIGEGEQMQGEQAQVATNATEPATVDQPGKQGQPATATQPESARPAISEGQPSAAAPTTAEQPQNATQPQPSTGQPEVAPQANPSPGEPVISQPSVSQQPASSGQAAAEGTLTASQPATSEAANATQTANTPTVNAANISNDAPANNNATTTNPVQTDNAQPMPAPNADFRPGPETVKALTLFIGRDNPGAVAALQSEGLAAAAEAMGKAAALPAEQGEAVLQSFVDNNPQLAQPDAQKLLAQLRNGTEGLRKSVQPQQDGMGALLGKLGDMFAKLDKDASKGIELKQANRLPQQLEDMEQAIAKTAAGAGKEAMTATVQRALGQSKAMEQINQFVYTQIPMELNGKRDMAELYVFKRPGRQKRIDAEQVTMVIALDTQNIGRVESLIKVDGKNVFLRFRVDGDGIANALRSGTIEAGEALASIGYNLLELRCELNEEDINILNAATTVQAEFLDVRNLDFFI